MDERRDDELFAEFRAAIDERDPVPDRVRFAARMSLASRSIDRDLGASPPPGSAEPGGGHPGR